ncbi:hypothetical protein LTR17_021900 [Elasticomyces elasticus]|nr:hypothetical protein LTR17_021900 [Elasticomyces elasticus]
MVAFQAAADCLNKQQLAQTRLSKMFDIDIRRLSLLAEGKDLSDRNLGWQQDDQTGTKYRRTYSEELRREAGELARARWAAERAALRPLVTDGPFGPLVDIIFELLPHESSEDKSAQASLALYDSLQENFWAGQDAYERASANPGSVGNGHTVPTPEGPEANKFEQPSSDSPHEDNEPDSEEGPVHEFPDSTPPETFDPIIGDAEEPDENIETPFLDDLNTKSALQRCQESTERELWERIGTTRAVEDTASSEAELQSQADSLRSLGICDKDFYGDEECQRWKNQVNSVPKDLSLEQEESGVITKELLCPVNLISPSVCELERQKWWAHFVTEETLETKIDSIFQPGDPVEVVPRLGFMLDSSKPSSTWLKNTGLLPGVDTSGPHLPGLPDTVGQSPGDAPKARLPTNFELRKLMKGPEWDEANLDAKWAKRLATGSPDGVLLKGLSRLKVPRSIALKIGGRLPHEEL